MNILLDTHIFLWLNDAPEKLSQPALDACQNVDNTLYLSLASVWEIQIKQQLGKLKHIETLSRLPSPHRDPFDRLLIAQGIKEQMHIISADQAFTGYPVSLIW